MGAFLSRAMVVEADASLLPPAAAAAVADDAAQTLPQPVKYEEIQREAFMMLKPELFEGFRFDFTKPLNQKFSLSHSVFMGNVEMPMQAGNNVVKVPFSTYEFGANLIDAVDSKYMLLGRITTDGRMTGRIKFDLTPGVSTRLQANLAPERGQSQAMVDVDLKGSTWQAQLKAGNPQYVGANLMKAVTPALALGGEYFALVGQRKQGFALAARHASEAWVGTAQVATTGLVSMSYMQKVSDKCSVATDLLYNWNTREAAASVGYDYIFRSSRLRGRLESSGTVAAFLEEKLNVGVALLLSAELDHYKKDYKFGFGMTVGE